MNQQDTGAEVNWSKKGQLTGKTQTIQVGNNN